MAMGQVQETTYGTGKYRAVVQRFEVGTTGCGLAERPEYEFVGIRPGCRNLGEIFFGDDGEAANAWGRETEEWENNQAKGVRDGDLE